MDRKEGFQLKGIHMAQRAVTDDSKRTSLNFFPVLLHARSSLTVLVMAALHSFCNAIEARHAVLCATDI